MNTQQHTNPRLQRLDGSPVRVLVVDDESNLTELLSMALRYEGWEVRTAANGQQAVRVAREFQPDAVALDMMLPVMNGVWLWNCVRHSVRKSVKSLPVVHSRCFLKCTLARNVLSPALSAA